MLRNGIGTNKDYKQAFSWYEKAAIKSQHSLGYMYGTGLGVKKDIMLAYSWFYVGMKQGHSASFVNANNLLEDLGNKRFEVGVKHGNELYLRYARKTAAEKPL